MTKLEFIARQLAKAQKKRYEHYVVNRVWTLLGDTSIKFVTQQYVARPDGRAMTDMYFPQLAIHIEVDEGFHKNQIEADQLREADIINATGHDLLRVDVTKDIDHINARVRSPMGDTMYRFKGEYEPDKNSSSITNGVIFRRIARRCQTYRVLSNVL